MKPAHIINQPGHEVGDKALTMCGVKWKINVLWEDIPDDHPICRDCVNLTLEALTEVTNQLAFASQRALLLLADLTQETGIQAIIDEQHEYADKRRAKAIAKAEKKAAKKAEKENDRPPIAPRNYYDDVPPDENVSGGDEVDTYLRSKDESEKWALLRAGARAAMDKEAEDVGVVFQPGAVQRTEGD